jgi:hypothetical protein
LKLYNAFLNRRSKLKVMIIEVLLVCVFCLLLSAVAVWFALRVSRIAIKEGKPNITININQPDKKTELQEMSEIFRTVNLLLTPKEILQIENEKKEND